MRQPAPAIYVVDDYYPDPSIPRSVALTIEKTASNRHKGIRSHDIPIHPFDKTFFCAALGLQNVVGYSCYQLCVAGDTLVYHSDSQRWAAVVYLTPDAPPQAGTSFYRSRRYPEVRSSAHVTPATEGDVYGNKLLDRSAWDEVDRIGNVYNRMVIWDARLIHAASEYFGHDLETGRLFQMFFFDGEP